MRCRSIRFTVHDEDANGYPVYAFEYFDGRKGPGPINGRTVMLAEDGRLKFTAVGEVAEFESPENYSKRRIVDRLNSELLSTYATRMGIDLFFVPDQDFYVVVDLLSRKANRAVQKQ